MMDEWENMNIHSSNLQESQQREEDERIEE